jgi:hypothetical protein
MTFGRSALGTNTVILAKQVLEAWVDLPKTRLSRSYLTADAADFVAFDLGPRCSSDLIAANQGYLLPFLCSVRLPGEAKILTKKVSK